MDFYLKVVKKLFVEFLDFSLTKISRGNNTSADALAALTSTSDPTHRRMIPPESIDSPSIDLRKGVYLIDVLQIKELGDGLHDTGEPNDLPHPPEETYDPDWHT